MKKHLPYLCIILLALAITLLYADTLRGHVINKNLWEGGPFGMEGIIYEGLSQSTNSFSASLHFKARKHYLCYLLYPVIHQSLLKILPWKNTPLVCSFLAGVGIVIFGLWIYRRTDYSPIAFPIMLIMGLTFTIWWNGAVWEGRIFIVLGSVILLISLDRITRQPTAGSLIFGIFSMIFMLLICIGNFYNLPLIPIALLTMVKKIGWKKLLIWSTVYLVSVLLIVALVYQVSGEYVNWTFKVPGTAKHLFWKDGQPWSRRGPELLLDGKSYVDVLSQALVYSVGAIQLPAGAHQYRRPYAPEGTTLCEDGWLKEDSFLAYFKHPYGIFFLVGYISLITLAAIIVIRKKLWSEDPIIIVFLGWIFLCIIFFAYAGVGWYCTRFPELQAPLWACLAIIFSRLKLRKALLILTTFLVILAWNNWAVIQFLKDYYARMDIKPPPEKIILCPDKEPLSEEPRSK